MSKHGARNTLAQQALRKTIQREKQMNDEPQDPNAQAQSKPQGAETQQPAPSILTFTYHAPGSAEFAIKVENVSPVQMLATAAWLDWYARLQFDMQLQARMAQSEAQQRSQGKIIVPQAVMPNKPIDLKIN